RGILLQLLLTTATGETSTSRDLGGQLVLTAYSRELEENADALALDALQRVYGHAGGATGLFEELREVEIFAPGGILASHPDLSSRIRAIEDRCDERGWPMEETAPYPDAVLEGLSSGP
ncbi:MAG: M48 family metalloprotease, partial [Planctomycetota bacterium]|nr:M48 family metalloprotease [Planctomycetota bacterium]